MIGRHGDVYGLTFRPYLVLSDGPGILLDEFVAADPTGRIVVARRGATLVLIDTRNGHSTTLKGAYTGPADRSDARRLLAFDHAGDRVAYVRRMGGILQIVVRQLHGDSEAVTDAGSGFIWRLRIDPEGKWTMIDVGPDEEPPDGISDLAPSSCRGPVSSYVRGPSPDPQQVIRRWARVGDRHMRETPGLIRPLRTGLLVRGPDGAVLQVSGTRTDVRIPSSCGAKLVYSDDGSRRIVALCAGRGAKTGILREFEGDKSFDIGMAPVPRTDLLIAAEGNVVRWREFAVDLILHAEVPGPKLRPQETSLVVPESFQARGVYAVRGDGAELTATRVEKTRDGDLLPIGPLRWLKMGEVKNSAHR